jgi:argininosuccinate lyase
MTVRVGGAGANAALAAVEAGMETRLIGWLGDDQLGAWMREQLAPAGLADELVVLAGETSGLTVALESPTRDRSFLTYLGVNARWEPATIPDDALTCENLLLCDYFVAPPLRGEAARRLLETARARGGRTFFDTTWDPDGFSSQTRAELRDLLPSVDVFLPNEVEACAIAGRAADGAQAAGYLGRLGGGQAGRPRMLCRGPRSRRIGHCGAGRLRRRHDGRRRRLQRRAGRCARPRPQLARGAGQRDPVCHHDHRAAVE